MNTNRLKRFAQEARRKLLQQVGSRMELVLTTDSAELREKAVALSSLKDAIKDSSKEQVIDKVAYTWFNRLMALRFMDVNEYQPTGVKIVTPKDGYTLPEILEDARQGQIPDELPVNKERIYDLLDGKIPSSNAQNEVYKELLIGACNQLHSIFPFLFEKIDDYTELLLPDDLTSEFSMTNEFMEGMLQEDCQEVEVIGWLYQFYISEKKDEVFASKSKVKKEDIPAATQLFTPRWIVKYMVQNTVGKLWLQNNPNSRLREHMEYFIESPSVEAKDYLKIDSVEEITLLDQACGSGHILVYGFELLSKIYEEEGYNPSEIPQFIIEKNLFGFEIDERAAQLAGFALMMKARSYHRRVFRKDLKPNILQFEDVSFTTEELLKVLPKVYTNKSKEFQRDLQLIENATNFGSLIQPESSLKFLKNGLEEIEKQLRKNPDLFLQDLLVRLKSGVTQLINLARKYHCVVDNPPYMGSGAMNPMLSSFVRNTYPASKADLMACFMEAGLAALKPNGFLGMINQHSWMFLSSYEKLRRNLIDDFSFDTLLHLGPRTFPEIGGEVVQNASFVLTNEKNQLEGVYFDLLNGKTTNEKREILLKCLEKLDHTNRYKHNKKDFKVINGHPISFWISDSLVNIFKENKKLKDFAHPSKGMMTGNGNRFIRFSWEVEENNFIRGIGSHAESRESSGKWYPYFKGGGYRKWYGNRENVVNFQYDGRELKSSDYGERSPQFYFLNQLNWSKVSGAFSLRIGEIGGLYDDAACQCPVINENDIFYLLGYLNTKVSGKLLGCISNTLNFSPGEIAKIPISYDRKIFPHISKIAKDNVQISKLDWDLKETSWDFKKNELVLANVQDIEESYDLFKQFWKNNFFEQHQNEEELNRQFIDLYGLQEEVTSDVPIGDITILKDEADFINGELLFDQKEVFSQFISYAVGCMFGRYSLDKEGLILANQGETLEEYLEKVGKGEAEVQFLPDDDNIIPVLDDEWFEDDIVGRFYEFLKASFGKENFDKNLAFVEECIGKDIRKYFVRDFYKDHIKRYKKRPIYWMFSSPKGSFNVLIYMHRYTPDTLNNILNAYLLEYREKLKARIEHLDHVIETGSSVEQTKAAKEKDRLRSVLLELQEYEREILYPLATERISINLDDGVLVNYNKFGKAIQEVKGLNDKKAKEKVKKFDWIETEAII
ncbi:type II restriction/modification system DNA methylase subunit YeeA [Salegentibacter sp. 24]|uniref:BREX-1 system adenine-specific DNA-methyltransferase PglX n=1 Tax=Salegentibacter sp. 24 TaxID=2183986 RepID=UPI00105EADA9|nr:BREX-1 system adenine-specific DNA-methyltransferase PglX [Salegentibacter sp. 24]TDN93369.1 type II restriction/modification system DNA methylase subunit YeeA [Salegentibacter sp. 24]